MIRCLPLERSIATALRQRSPRGTSCPGRASRSGDPGEGMHMRRLLLPDIPLPRADTSEPATTLLEEEPMTAEQQLERSVLEGKERDELSAIAQAMSLKTMSLTEKGRHHRPDTRCDWRDLRASAKDSRNGYGGTNGAKWPGAHGRWPGQGAADAASFVSGDGDAGGSPLQMQPMPPVADAAQLVPPLPRCRPMGTPDRPSSSSRPNWPTAPTPCPAERQQKPQQPDNGPETNGGTATRTGTRATREPEQPGQPEQSRQPVRRRRGQPPQSAAPRPRASGQGGELQGGGQDSA